MKVVAEQGSPEYYETAAIIAIKDAQEARHQGLRKLYTVKMNQACQLLCLAQAYYGTPEN